MSKAKITEQLDEYAYANWQGHVGYSKESRSYVITDKFGGFCFVSDEFDISDLEQSIDTFCDCF